MPKIKASVSSRLQKFCDEYKDVFSTDGKVLFCQPCGKSVAADQRSQITQHLESKKHIAAASRLSKRQAFIGQPIASSSGEPSKLSAFSMDLCRAFVSADIPLFKLKNPELRKFLVKYTNFEPPDESTLRKTYLHRCYEQTLQHIRSECAHQNIWVCMDETTDSSGRKVGNVIVGVLSNDDETVLTKNYLLVCKELSAATHVTIARLFNEAMQLLWPEGIKFDNVLLLVTDAAAYMKKAAVGLAVSYPKMVHVTCVAHALHRICEKIRVLYPKVDKLVSNGKKVFIKSPKRIDIFNQKCPGIPLPPAPVVTRWGTWLDAVEYYAQNFEQFVSVVNDLDKDEASSIEILQELLKDPSVKLELAFISTNLSFLSRCIEKLESSSNTLSASVGQIRIVETKLKELTGANGQVLMSKFTDIFEKNQGFQTLCKIARVLEGEVEEDVVNFSVSEISCFKYARIVSCDVERSFSQYKMLFRDNRHKFTMENLGENYGGPLQRFQRIAR